MTIHMPVRKSDPIKAAARITNQGNARSHAARLYRDRSNLIREERALRDFEARVWKPVYKKIRKAFRDEFREPAWEGLRIEFYGLGYTKNGITHCIDTWVEYGAYWKGFKIHGKFSPQCLEDVVAETWKLGGLFAGPVHLTRLPCRLNWRKR